MMVGNAMDDMQTELETEVMKLLLQGDDPTLQVLRDQLRLAEVASREFSGVGFFTQFKFKGPVKLIPRGRALKIGDVEAEIEGLMHGAGFLLYIENGALHMLEGYSYDEEWPLHIGNFKVSYDTGHVRDMAALREKLHALPPVE